MKCTNKNKKQTQNSYDAARRRKALRKRRRRQQQVVTVLVILILCLTAIGIAYLIHSGSKKDYVIDYETKNYNKSLYKGDTFAKDLCVTSNNVSLEGYSDDDSLGAAGLFDIKNNTVLYADNIHTQLYPASTTKVMTAYVALKYGNLDDIVTISENAVNLEADAQVCGFEAGDQVSMYDLMNGLLLYSGNDAALAIAEHVGGSVEAFVQKMNEEAKALGATNTNFVNPHGLHDPQQYTTAYDLYLMFNACSKNPTFIDIISQKSYSATITSADGDQWTTEWIPTNYYSAGEATPPEGVNVLGGKTGTTDEAGSCVILYNQDMDSNPYISVIMGADTKTILYDDMTALLAAGVGTKSSEK